MRILLLGGGGPIGEAAARRIRARGDEALWASRTAPAPPDPSHARVDRAQPDQVADLVRRLRPDVLVDMVAYTLGDTAPLLAAVDGLVGRYVMASSCDVYRNYGLLHRKESGEPQLGLLTETSPLRTSRHPYRAGTARAADAADRWMDDYDKIPLEEALRRSAAEWTILRLPMVYGPGDRQRRFRWISAPMTAGAEVIRAPAAWLAWVTTYGFVENVGEAIALAAAHPKAARQVFNVADERPMPHSAWIERFKALTGWSGEVQATSSPDDSIALATAALDLAIPLGVSADRLVEDLGYKPPVDPMTAARLALSA